MCLAPSSLLWVFLYLIPWESIWKSKEDHANTYFLTYVELPGQKKTFGIQQ